MRSLALAFALAACTIPARLEPQVPHVPSEALDLQGTADPAKSRLLRRDPPAWCAPWAWKRPCSTDVRNHRTARWPGPFAGGRGGSNPRDAASAIAGALLFGIFP